MKIAFFTDCVNHHQVFVADCLYNLSGGNYTFVTTIPFPEHLAKKGYPDYSDRPYLLPAWKNTTNKRIAMELAVSADVAIFMGNRMEEYEIPRLKAQKLTLEYSERRLKKGMLNLLSPNLIRHQMMYYLYGRKAPLYMLCSSAYAASDFYFMRSFEDKCYKWGYFPEFKPMDIESCIADRDKKKIRIMWCSRFIDWKHPELPILLAKYLKNKKYKFTIDMYGSGEMYQSIRSLSISEKVEDVVNFIGGVSNDKIIDAMRQHHIFLFTSDKREGWGVVANEAMGCGCCLIASDEIGSVPYLVENNINGLIFKSNNLDSLCCTVESVINNREVIDNLGRNAYRTIQEVWSPNVASQNLYTLLENLMKGIYNPIPLGPCSKATPY